MGSSRYVEEGFTCTHCGEKSLTRIYLDAGGHESVDYSCEKCGFRSEQDVGCGSDWAGADWTVSSIDGVAFGYRKSDKYSLLGPWSLTACQNSDLVSSWDWVHHMSPTGTIVSVKAAPQGEDVTSRIEKASEFLSRLKLYPERVFA